MEVVFYEFMCSVSVFLSHLGCLSLLLALCLMTGLEPAAEEQAPSCHSSTIVSSLFKPGTISKKLPERSHRCADNPACNYTSSISHPSVLGLPWADAFAQSCSRLCLPSQPTFRKTADLQSSTCGITSLSACPAIRPASQLPIPKIIKDC